MKKMQISRKKEIKMPNYTGLMGLFQTSPGRPMKTKMCEVSDYLGH